MLQKLVLAQLGLGVLDGRAVAREEGARAQGGEGQVVLFSGEPGIGKSRLTRAIQEQLGAEATVALFEYSGRVGGRPQPHK